MTIATRLSSARSMPALTRILSIGTGEGPPDLEAAIRVAEKYDAGVSRVLDCIRSMRRRSTQADYDRLADAAASSEGAAAWRDRPRLLLEAVRREAAGRCVRAADADRRGGAEADQHSYTRRVG